MSGFTHSENATNMTRRPLVNILPSNKNWGDFKSRPSKFLRWGGLKGGVMRLFLSHLAPNRKCETWSLHILAHCLCQEAGMSQGLPVSQSELERVMCLPALIPVRTGESFLVHWKDCATSHQKEASKPTGMPRWNPEVGNACLDTQEAFAFPPGI